MKHFNFQTTDDHPLSNQSVGNDNQLIQNNVNNAPVVEQGEEKILNAGEVMQDEKNDDPTESINASLHKIPQPHHSLRDIITQPISHLAARSRSLVTNYFNFFNSKMTHTRIGFETKQLPIDKPDMELTEFNFYRGASYSYGESDSESDHRSDISDSTSDCESDDNDKIQQLWVNRQGR